MATWEIDDVANQALWLRADTGVTESGGAVSAWADQSSTGATVSQSTAASKPAYSPTGWDDVLPAIDFDGSDDCLGITGLSSAATEMTFFACVDVDDISSSVYKYILDIETGRVVFASVGGRLMSTGFYNGSDWIDRAGITGKQILTFVLDTAGASIYRNGGLLISDGAYSSLAISGDIAIGSNNGQTAAYFDGRMTEMALYTAAVSDIDREKIEAQLAYRWGLLDQLAYDHTYTAARLPVPDYGSSGGPAYQALVDKIASGYERREAVRSDVPKRFECQFSVQTLDEIQTLLAFFMAHKGRGYSFRYKDFSDFSATGETCSGSGTDWQLQKRYQAGTQTFTRTIIKPVYGTVTLYDSGTALDTDAYEIDYQTGEITLDSSATGTITADFEFDCCVRFDTDELSQQLIEYDYGSTATLPLVEVAG